METTFKVKESDSNGGEFFLYANDKLLGVYADVERVVISIRNYLNS